MTNNTTKTPSSSLPFFMAEIEQEQAEAAGEVQEIEETERGLIEARASAIEKATTRLTQQAEYMERISGVVESVLPEIIAGNPLGQSIDLFVSLEEAVLEADDQLKALKKSIDRARSEWFPARLDAEDCKTTTSKDTGNRITRTARVFASIVSAKTEIAHQWLRDHGLGSLIKPTVNASSLSAAVKEALENGTEFPEDVFSIHVRDSVSITRGKKK